jgi:foldase protein PrsA
MSDRNEEEQLDNKQIENEIVEKEQVDNEQFESELDVQEEQELVESDKIESDPLENKSESVIVADQQPNSARNSSALIAPWVITVIAIAALIFVLVRNPSGSMNETVGKMDGATFTTADLYTEMSKQMGKDQQGSMLDNIMTLKLIDLESVKAGVVVTDAEFQQELDKIKKSFGTEEEFTAALQQYNMTLDTLKEQVSTQLKLRKIIEKQNPAKEEDLKAYYDKNKENFATTPHQVRASHILLPTKAEAEAVLAELKAGKDFATLAKAKSTDPGSKDNGGDLNFFSKGQMNPEFEAAAFALKKGEMSGVVEAPDSGFHIIKVTDIIEAVIPPYDTIKEEVKTAYYDEKMQVDGQTWMDKVKKERNYVNLLIPAASAPAASAPAASAPASASPQAK